jgi:hypothetical protein
MTFGPLDNVKLSTWIMIAVALLLVILMLWVANAKDPRFIHVHGPSGQNIEVNIEEISSMRTPQPRAEGHFPKGTQCVLYMTSGNFIAVQENCTDVDNRIKELNDKSN